MGPCDLHCDKLVVFEWGVRYLFPTKSQTAFLFIFHWNWDSKCRNHSSQSSFSTYHPFALGWVELNHWRNILIVRFLFFSRYTVDSDFEVKFISDTSISNIDYRFILFWFIWEFFEFWLSEITMLLKWCKTFSFHRTTYSSL